VLTPLLRDDESLGLLDTFLNIPNRKAEPHLILSLIQDLWD